MPGMSIIAGALVQGLSLIWIHTLSFQPRYLKL